MDLFRFQFDNLWKNYLKRWKVDKKPGKRIMYLIGLNIYMMDILLIGFGLNIYYFAMAFMNFTIRIRWGYPPPLAPPKIKQAQRRMPQPHQKRGKK